MYLLNKRRYIFTIVVIAFAAFVFSWCNSFVEPVGMATDNPTNGSKCCEIIKNQVMTAFHNQPLYAPFAGNMLQLVVVFVLSAFVFSVFKNFTVDRKFLLYEKYIKRNKGSTKLYNFFVQIFSKGILHSQVF